MWAACAAVVVALSVAACGGGASSSDRFAEIEKLSGQQLVDEANKEGSVSFYTEFTASNLKATIDSFHQQYPQIAVQPLTLDQQSMVSRIATEQRGGQFNADIITEDALHMGQLISSSAVTPYEPADRPAVPSSLKLPQGFQSVAFVTSNVIAYNPKLLQQKGIAAPASYQDLTKPEWRGNFSMAPDGADLLEALGGAMGHDKALVLVQQLGQNSPRLVSSHSQAVAQVQAGEPLATLSYGSYAAAAKQKTPDSVDFVNPNPMPSDSYEVAVGKNAPHPAAARVFMDWLETKTGQQSIIKSLGFSSVRDDVNNDPSIWDPAKFPPVFPPAESVDEFNAQLKEYKDAINAP